MRMEKMAKDSMEGKVMEEEARVERMVKLMIRRVIMSRCMEGEVVKFVQEDTVIFVTRLHSMGQGKAKVNRKTMLMIIAIR